MKKTISSSIFAILIFMSCSKSEIATKEVAYPECLSTQIQLILGSATQTPKANIQKYNYKGIVVYAVNYIKNDGTNLEVYNDKCELICSTGSTIDGTPFNSCIDWNKATLIETVWSDPR
jgi:hypothetical protein